MIAFKVLTGWCGTKEWVSPRLSNGEFNYYLVIRIMDMTNTGREWNDPPDRDPWLMEIMAVAPSLMSEEANELIVRHQGPKADRGELNQIAELVLHGTYAPLWGKWGDSPLSLMMDARKEANSIESLFGLYMDKPVNRIGTTGWEAIVGDIQSGLNRKSGDGTVEGSILRKMHKQERKN